MIVCGGATGPAIHQTRAHVQQRQEAPPHCATAAPPLFKLRNKQHRPPGQGVAIGNRSCNIQAEEGDKKFGVVGVIFASN